MNPVIPIVFLYHFVALIKIAHMVFSDVDAFPDVLYWCLQKVVDAFLSLGLAIVQVHGVCVCFSFIIAILNIHDWNLQGGVNMFLSLILAIIKLDDPVHVLKAQPEKDQAQVVPNDKGTTDENGGKGEPNTSLPINLSGPDAGISLQPICRDLILRPKCGSSILTSTSNGFMQQAMRPEFLLLPLVCAAFHDRVKNFSLNSMHLDLGPALVVSLFKEQKSITRTTKDGQKPIMPGTVTSPHIDLSESDTGIPLPTCTELILRPKCGSSFLTSTSNGFMQQAKRSEFLLLPSVCAAFHNRVKNFSLMSMHLDLGPVLVVSLSRNQKPISQTTKDDRKPITPGTVINPHIDLLESDTGNMPLATCTQLVLRPKRGLSELNSTSTGFLQQAKRPEFLLSPSVCAAFHNRVKSFSLMSMHLDLGPVRVVSLFKEQKSITQTTKADRKPASPHIDLPGSDTGIMPLPTCTELVLRPKRGLSVLNSTSNGFLQQTKRPEFLLSPSVCAAFHNRVKNFSLMSMHIDLDPVLVLPLFKEKNSISQTTNDDRKPIMPGTVTNPQIELSESDTDIIPLRTCTELILRPRYGSSSLSLDLESNLSQLVRQIKCPALVEPPRKLYFDLQFFSSLMAPLDLRSFQPPKLILPPVPVTTQIEVVSAVTAPSAADPVAKAFLGPSSLILPSTSDSTPTIESDPEVEAAQQKMAVETKKHGGKKAHTKKAHTKKPSKKWQKARDRQTRYENFVKGQAPIEMAAC
ncbi:hypothetical protein MMC07_005580 [Pseudocyphellaria aurata]|nr:hypothetical protein [Pseudocyphellaria aurata]